MEGYIRFTICVINLILHGTGSYIFISTFLTPSSLTTITKVYTIQRVYLINLSLTEMMKNIILMSYDIIRWWHPSYTFPYLTIVYENGVAYLYIIAMFLITGDRLLATHLGIRYQLIWSGRKARNLLIAVYTICISICAAIILSRAVLGQKRYDELGIRAIMTSDVCILLMSSFVVFAVGTYLFIFYKYVESKRRFEAEFSSSTETDSGSVVAGSLSTKFRLFCETRFFVSVLLVTSFLVFTVIPELVLGILEMHAPDDAHILSPQFRQYLIISFSVSDTFDAVVYIFLQRRVREIIVSKAKSVCRQRSVAEKHTMVIHRQQSLRRNREKCVQITTEL